LSGFLLSAWYLMSVDINRYAWFWMSKSFGNNENWNAMVQHQRYCGMSQINVVSTSEKRMDSMIFDSSYRCIPVEMWVRSINIGKEKITWCHQVVSLGGPDGIRPCDLGLSKTVLRWSRPPSPLLDTLFALQEFVYECVERAHLLFNCAVFPSCVNLSLLSVIVNYGSSWILMNGECLNNQGFTGSMPMLV